MPETASIAPTQTVMRAPLATLTLTALGVVYGDIGTSPLYAVKEVFNPIHGIPFSVENLLGGVSAIFWSLMIVVSVKYVILIMRASNKGEGGIMALVALAISSVKDRRNWGARLALVGVFGAALFYGDGVITPAISVLSAIEGLEVATPLFKPYIVPLTVFVVIVLFVFQRKGTAAVGALFGPIVIVWFSALAVIGVRHIVQEPRILQGLNPAHAYYFLTQHGFASFVVLGSVFLAVTGAEALYADMGHFGKHAVRVAWFGCVLPGLTLNYFGQGALLIANPEALKNPFYLMFPPWALYPMVILATLATIIASQAVISGTYSMTKQAIQLGYLPRMKIIQTSAREIGQIYIPSINWILLLAVIVAVVGFGSSTNIASAYGVAVSGTMLITTFLTFFILRYCWHYNLFFSLACTGFFMLVDFAFLAANMVKLFEGGWFPFAIGIFIFTLMVTWRRGRTILFEKLRTSAIALQPFLDSLFQHGLHRVKGTAVFLNREPDAVPHALLHNLAHNQVMHERTVFVTIVIKEVPWVPAEKRVGIESLGNNCYRITAYFGFKDTPDLMDALEQCRTHGLDFNVLETSFFLSRETVIAVPGIGMAMWRERLFAGMVRNAGSVVEYFHIPPNRVIELGTQVEM
jgi:KUP system potassium uptake protein